MSTARATPLGYWSMAAMTSSGLMKSLAGVAPPEVGGGEPLGEPGGVVMLVNWWRWTKVCVFKKIKEMLGAAKVKERILLLKKKRNWECLLHRNKGFIQNQR